MTSAWIVFAILFWVLAALATVGILLWAFVQFQYYLWDKQDRAFHQEEISDDDEIIVDTVNN